jgi:hypothetical protein
MPNETSIIGAIKRVIGNPKGKCYYASEAAYHLLGGKEAGYTPMVATYDESDEATGRYFHNTHWWLRRADGTILDITAGQYDYCFPYSSLGKGCGFLTKRPSKRAQEIIDAVHNSR